MGDTTFTVGALVDDVLDTVHGYSRAKDSATSVSVGFTDTDLSFYVVDASSVSVGTIEVEDELMRVKASNESTGAVEIEPWGRGLSGTTAVSHSAGARVTTSPLFPRAAVLRALAASVRETFPDIYPVSSTLLDGSPVRTNYTMPSDCFNVLSVETYVLGGSGMWAPVGRWRQNKLPSSVELEVIGPVTPGADRVRVVYAANSPDPIDTSTDLLAAGYSRQVRDVVSLGAAAHLLMGSESARVQVESMVATGRAEASPAGAATAAGRALYQVFRQRVRDESRQLQLRYPPQWHKTR